MNSKNTSFFILKTAFLLLIVSSCIKEKSTPKTMPSHGVEKPFEVAENDAVQEKVGKEEENDSIVDISGDYELVEGYTDYIGSEDDVIYKAAISIERLSETDFGFYSAYKVQEISPIGNFGVIRSFKNNFQSIAFCDFNREESDGYSKANFIKGFYLFNHFMIQKKDDTLALIRYGSNMRRYLIYKKKKPEVKHYISLVRTLKRSKLDYEAFLVDYKKAVNYTKSKLEIDYFFENGIWKTRHYHKGNIKEWRHTYGYQPPYEDDTFVKTDSLFLNRFK